MMSMKRGGGWTVVIIIILLHLHLHFHFHSEQFSNMMLSIRARAYGTS